MTAPDSLVDTSAAVALVLGGHEAHDRTLTAVSGMRLGLAGHAWFETYSVLTRIPPPARRSPHEVVQVIETNFPESRFLSSEETKELTRRLVSAEISGGAVYDALVGYAALKHELPLASRDRRAADVYRTLGVTVELLD